MAARFREINEMRVLITGGSGFVGTHLSRHCLDSGHHVTALGTRKRHGRIDHPRFVYCSADTTRPGPWQQHVANSDWIFNLAGRSIFQRWTRRSKQQIYDSRVLTTRCVVDALASGTEAVLVSASAVGYYGHGDDAELTESSPGGEDFLASVSRDWEREASGAGDKGGRVAVARFGIVLGADGGALARMVPAFRAYVGGPLGDGRQWFPWIHIDDVAAACCHLALHDDLHGPFNFCAPTLVRNREMVRALGNALGRPASMAVPGWVLKMAMGELAGVLLGGQRAIPSRLTAAGFEFRHPRIDGALGDLVAPKKG
jgi:uncharacterized protein (TIGR01777 family)